MGQRVEGESLRQSRFIVRLVAALMIVYAAINLEVGINGVIHNIGGDEPVFDDPQMAESYERGKIVALPSTWLLSILVHAIVLVGAIIMATGRRGPLPLIAALLLLLPCSTFFFVGMPLGLIALIILSNRASLGAFDGEAPLETSTTVCPNCGRTNSIHTKTCPKCEQRIQP